MTVSLYAAVFALFFIALSIHVVRGRRHYRVGIGDGGKEDMQQRIRAHGNFIEYTPLFLLMLALAEYNGLPTYGVHGFGSAFFLGRLLHVYSVLHVERYEWNRLTTHVRFRIRAMVITFSTITLLALALLWQFLTS